MPAATDYQYLIDQLPYAAPFLFADEILHVDEDSISGAYTYKADEFFYPGHFPAQPVTPGVILIETMAQIGLVSLGIYLISSNPTINISTKNISLAFTTAEIDFLKPVFPEEKVIVESEKLYFRLKKLKCKVRMIRPNGDIICKGILSGMIIPRQSDE